MTTHALIAPSAPASQPSRRRPEKAVAAGGWPTPEVDPATFTTLPEDLAALVWDLTVHRLHRVFAECLKQLSDATRNKQVPRIGPLTPDGPGLAGVRLAAACHAVDDIRNAWHRMAAGTYGTCEKCLQPITTELLKAAPTTRWCATCGADLRG
jgi:hypothetical protein